MPSRRITYRGCKFEVWEKSMRFVEPFVSQLFFSPAVLDDTEAKRFAEKLLGLVNQGLQHAKLRLGDYP